MLSRLSFGSTIAIADFACNRFIINNIVNNITAAGMGDDRMEIAQDPNGKAPNALQVADFIRERIRRGRLVPGQRLVEVEIIRQTGASRAKVREAFQRLEVEGLVEIEEYRGASVRDAGISEVRQIYQCRACLLYTSPSPRDRG